MAQRLEVDPLDHSLLDAPELVIRLSGGPEGARPEARGKFLFVDGQKLYVRGVTYGTFQPQGGVDYPDAATVALDFKLMAANGINAIRTYTVPPRWLLDEAQSQGLWVMVGVPWEQHIAFLDSRRRARGIEDKVRSAVADCAGHSAVLSVAVGNEIPSSIVRWYGRGRVETFIERLYGAAKEEDPEGLVTYVSYPSTEYLQLPFLDLATFNVYLEAQDRLEAYLTRLQNVAGDLPLILAEVGLDSRRNGSLAQANSLESQVRTTFCAGGAGVFVFAWTDEWHRGGDNIEDWDFGLTDRDRNPKPALGAVRRAFAEVPFPSEFTWPRISVIVCSHNGSRTLMECLEGVEKLDYPDYEVIVVDDGSSDATASIAAEFSFKVISTENRGLGAARNTGLAAATGEIVAYIDDDAFPDPDWLTYLAAAFTRSAHVGIGGPNIVPGDDADFAQCVARSPGGPVHVLLTDELAEHIPGCNMAFRRTALEAIGGFDECLTTAGDDVDVCWRLQARGWTLGFSAAAMVWHRRRSSFKAYWRQQRGYGKAEALLENKWPQKYNAVGHLRWMGRIYGSPHAYVPGRVQRVYHGAWGTAPFQSLDDRPPSLLASLLSMPESYLILFALLVISALGFVWSPLLWMLPAFTIAILAAFVQAITSARRVTLPRASSGRRARLLATTAFLHLIQPWARLWGRLRHGLTLWRGHGGSGLQAPVPRRPTAWSERWNSTEGWIKAIEVRVRSRGSQVFHGGPYDRWDFEVRGGTLGAVRVRMAIEEHGAGRQLLRFRLAPRVFPGFWPVACISALLTLTAARDGAILAAALLALPAAAVIYSAGKQCGTAAASALSAIRDLDER